MNKIAEDIFQSIDILIDKKLENLSFNKTEVATIIDVSQSDKGIYKVNTGNISYEANSTQTNYQIGDIVFIIIPNNDYNNKKFILGLQMKGVNK